MNTIQIPKKSGGTRTIVVPTLSEKKVSWTILNNLNKIQQAINLDCVYGFVHNKNICDCASAHIGFQYTLSMDLKDFFDSVRFKHIEYLTKSYTIDSISVKKIEHLSDGFGRIARQGLPYSPALANLAARDMDIQINAHAKNIGIVYTRYADDLVFSSNSKDDLITLKHDVLHIVQSCNFSVNEKKTRLQSAGVSGNDTRIVVGIGVNKTNILLNRKKKRKLRALHHNLSKEKAPNSPLRRRYAGYVEFSKLKTANKREPGSSIEQLRQDIIVKLFSLPKL